MSKVYLRTFDKLHLNCLTAEQRERTCSYWYTVTAFGHTSHTAFRTRAALVHWLDQHGLGVAEEIPAEGTHAHLTVIGEYREAMHGDLATFYAEKGTTTRKMSNGDYTLGILNRDEDGAVIIHYLNPNAERVKFDHAESRAIEDAGQL